MKKNIAIIMGGYSSEYKISLKSGSVVFETLDRNLYTPFAIHIFKEKWVYVNENNEEFPVDKNDFSITHRLPECKKYNYIQIFLFQ